MHGFCALQRAQMLVSSNARSDDDARSDAEFLVREVDRLNGLAALQLVDRKRMAIHATMKNGSGGR